MNSSQPQISLTIITYRDSFQWVAKEKEGLNAGYQQISTRLQISPRDKATLGISDNARVKLSNSMGTIVVQAIVEEKCQPGYGYMAVSPYINSLTSYDPAKAKLPNFKLIEVTAESTDVEITPIGNL